MKKYLYVRLFTEKQLPNKTEKERNNWEKGDKLASLKFENSVTLSNLNQKRKFYDEIAVSNLLYSYEIF